MPLVPRFKKPALILLPALLLLTLTITLTAHAQKTARDLSDTTILSRVDAELLLGQIDRTVDLFNSPEIFWTGTTDSAALSAPTVLPFDGEQIFEGSRSLLVEESFYHNSSGVGILRTFSESLPDFTSGNFFTFSLCLPEEADYTVNLTIRSSLIDVGQSQHRLNYERTASLSGSGWHTLLFDISAFQGRASVREIEIEVLSSAAQYGMPYTIAFDAIGFCSSASPATALRYLSDSYIGTGCTLTYDDTMSVAVEGNAASFSASDLPQLTMNRESALCVSLINQSGFRSLTCTYRDSEKNETREVSQTLETATQSVQYCYFPIDAATLSEVTFALSGGSGGTVSILSIAPVSYFVSKSAGLGVLNECLLEQSKTHLEVTGNLNEGTAAAFPTAKLRLYELPLGANVADLQAEGIALSEIAITDAFSFHVQATSEALVRAYCVALVNGEQILPISEPIHVQNPEILQSTSASLPTTDSKKGFYALENTTVFDGIAYTAIPVRLETLVTLDRTAFTFETDGQNYYYSLDALIELDDQITLCRERGTRAILVLTVSPCQDAALNRILLHPDSTADASECAFNTETAEGIRYLRAAVRMLATRYTPKEGDIGGLLGFAVGQNVNNSREHYSLGSTTLLSFVNQYAAALRTVYQTAVSVNPSLSVYVSLDCVWNGENTRQNASRFGAKQTLDLLDYLITLQGDFPWQIAYDPYPEEEYYAYEDTDAKQSTEADRVTLANLEVLTGYLSKTSFCYDRQYRSVILLEQCGGDAEAVSENAWIRQSADYVYGYYKISTRNLALVRALIIHRDVNYNDTLCFIDTDRSTEVVSYALEVIEITDWSQRLTAFDPSLVVIRTLSENQLTHETPSSAVGQLTLWEFQKTGPTGGWKAGNGAVSLSPGVTVGDEFFLAATMAESTPAAYREIYVRQTTPYDFTLTPYLRFTCNVSGLPADISELELTVAVFSGEHCLRAVGTVSAGKKNTVVVDMQDFTWRTGVDCIRILLRGKNGEEIGTPTLLIGQIDALSDRYSGDELKDQFEKDQNPNGTPTDSKEGVDRKTVILLASVLTVSALLETIRIIGRQRRKGNRME